uniref:Uncharacterized protein n=1 Tax=Corethron hystrix TaxID=216773 RepID=A0A7S1BVT9_9STRA
MNKIFSAVVSLALFAFSAHAFLPVSNNLAQKSYGTTKFGVSLTSPARTAKKSSLQMRQWNFNDSRSPFGFANNAEIWNGRVAQVGLWYLFLFFPLFVHSLTNIVSNIQYR